MSGFFGAAMGELSSLVSSEHAGAASGLLSTALASSGGVSGLIDKCQQAGLGAHVSSWMGSGSNMPIGVAEIEKIFPPEQIEACASQHGVPTGVATQLLAKLLPHAVDAATPDGTTPAKASDTSDGDTDDSASS